MILPMAPIYLEYKPAANDHVEAYRAYSQMSWLYRADRIVGVLLTIVGIVFGAISIYLGLGLYLSVVSAVFVICGITEWLRLLDLGELLTRWRFKTDRKFQELQTLIFRSDGITYKTASIDSRIEWTFYSKYLESANVFLLIYGKRQYSVIPKAAIPARQLEQFRTLVHNKINAVNS